jgi:hypothetical protein
MFICICHTARERADADCLILLQKSLHSTNHGSVLSERSSSNNSCHHPRWHDVNKKTAFSSLQINYLLQYSVFIKN